MILMMIVGTMQALSAMLHLELPHVSVITKMDLLPASEDDPFAMFPSWSSYGIPS